MTTKDPLKVAIEYVATDPNFKHLKLVTQVYIQDALTAALSQPAEEQEPAMHQARCYGGSWDEVTEESYHHLQGCDGYEVRKLFASPVQQEAKPYLEIGEMVEIDDGFGTIFCEWKDDRWNLPAGTKVYAVIPQADAKPEQITRKAYICKSCEGVITDAPTTQCDCMEEHSKGPFIEGVVIYPAPPQAGAQSKEGQQ